jgi:sec-independent protein translocase protein TatA
MFASIGLPGLLVIAFVVLLLFGRGRLGAWLGDAGRGVMAMRKAVRRDPEPALKRLLPPHEQSVAVTSAGRPAK